MKRSAVRETVKRFRVANPRVFGSVLHGTDREGSDLDLLRSMRNRLAHGYFEINLDLVSETVQEWLPQLLAQLPAARGDAESG